MLDIQDRKVKLRGEYPANFQVWSVNVYIEHCQAKITIQVDGV